MNKEKLREKINTIIDEVEYQSYSARSDLAKDEIISLIDQHTKPLEEENKRLNKMLENYMKKDPLGWIKSDDEWSAGEIKKLKEENINRKTWMSATIK